MPIHARARAVRNMLHSAPQDTSAAIEQQERRVNQSLHQLKAAFFKALAHPTRIEILEQLRGGEQCVNDLQAAIGIDQSTVSQQLALLRSRNIVVSRKAGTSVYYRVRDPLIFQLLDGARALFDHQLISTQELLQQPAQNVAAL